MIEYVEIRNKYTRKIVGIIDSAQSIIWHTTYYGVGDFEIYASASKENMQLLKEGYYVTRPNEIDIGIIEKVEIFDNVQDGTMITATGRFAKSILDRRQIYKLNGKVNTPTILRGNVEQAVRNVVSDNAISCSFDSKRDISFLELGAVAGIPLIIVDEQGNATQKQVSYANLLEYTDEVLQEYKLGSTIVIDDETSKLQYAVYQGVDRTIDNESGNESIIFSPEFDNLTESQYALDMSAKKTAILIGGEGEGLARFYSLIVGEETGFERRETWLDASSISKTYEDEHGETQEYTDAEYKAMIDALGKQELAALIAKETFEGVGNLAGGKWKLNEDFFLGDLVTVQNNKLGVYVNARITELLEKQDADGYAINPTFEFENESTAIAIVTESGVVITTENGVALNI